MLHKNIKVLSLLLLPSLGVRAKDWKIALTAGPVFSKMTNSVSSYDKTRIGVNWAGNIGVTKTISNWQLDLTASLQRWHSKQSIYSYSLTGRSKLERTLIIGNPVYSLSVSVARKWGMGNNYWVTGVFSGMNYATGNGERRCGLKALPSGAVVLYDYRINYYNTSGWTVGLQFGYYGKLNRRLGYCINVRPNISNMTVMKGENIDPAFQYYDYDYKIWNFPIALGLTYDL